MPMRRRYNVGEKLRIIAAITIATTRDENPVSIRQACRAFDITATMFLKWRAKILDLLGYKRSAYKMHSGRPSSVNEDHENLLLEWITLKRDYGDPVCYTMLRRVLGQLDADFRVKSANAQRKVISRWAIRNVYVYRVTTHTAQRPPGEVMEEARQFVLDTAPRLAVSFHGRRDKDYIINMDQTPVFFSFGSKRTLEKMGSRSVCVRGATHIGSTSRATSFLSVTASGRMLMSLIVFKGTPDGLIARELRNYPAGAAYQTQIKAWCDKRVMLYWVNYVLGPYVQRAPPDVRPVLLMDRFSVHLMDEVVDLIYAMGVEIIYVPGGCTSLAQPLDVGINKPFKDRIRGKWENWVCDEQAIHGMNHHPKADRQMVSQWIIDSNNTINQDIGRNAWLHRPYNYFPIEE